jgi:predicted GTPase
MTDRRRVVILGAAGRDFHNFNTVFRDDPSYEVVAFTATQIPNIADRKYPAVLAGPHYPEGIPIVPESELEQVCAEKDVDEVVFAYSDVSHEHVMHQASRVNAIGPDFALLGCEATMIKAEKPVISVCAVRTGCGKSQTTRKVARILRERGKRVAIIRHPMPYGDLAASRVQRYAEMEDMKQASSIEEREEYEHHVLSGNIVYAGVDYADILEAAQKEADVILWDGGNNDTSFYRPDLEIVVVDPHRAGDELTYHPGETNLRRAQVVIMNKVATADQEEREEVLRNVRSVNPRAVLIEAASPVHVDDPARIRGARVLAVEDGPSVTHGEMPFGAAVVAATKYGAAEVVSAREHAVGTITETYEKYPEIGPVLPAMGYGERQVKDLEETINAVPCDLVLLGTPINLGALLDIDKPSLRVTYRLQEIGEPVLEDVLKPFF